MCMRVPYGVLVVMMRHGPLHVGMRMLVQRTHAISVREQGVARGGWRLGMTWGTECWMVCRARPWRGVMKSSGVLCELVRDAWGLLSVVHRIGGGPHELRL